MHRGRARPARRSCRAACPAPERIEAAAKEAGPGAVALECDVTDEASCRSAVGAAADALGGIDHLIYTPPSGRWSGWSIPMPERGGTSSTPTS
ncbi:nAD dependent epimerase/dehydratase family protein [Mycobacterium xenopi 3993]|nr:nAD dependent epimerase/dehydratase family protein [Mycobacterium xenopi 3993]